MGQLRLRCIRYGCESHASSSLTSCAADRNFFTTPFCRSDDEGVAAVEGVLENPALLERHVEHAAQHGGFPIPARYRPLALVLGVNLESLGAVKAEVTVGDVSELFPAEEGSEVR